MGVTLRAPTETDWPHILRVANEAAPWAAEENRLWCANRRSFDPGARRRHYVAVDAGQQIIGYGAVEEGPEPAHFRVFVVMSTPHLTDGIGDLVFNDLMRDIDELGGSVAWMREEARGDALIDFAERRGFREPPSFAFEGRAIVVLTRPFAPGASAPDA